MFFQNYSGSTKAPNKVKGLGKVDNTEALEQEMEKREGQCPDKLDNVEIIAGLWASMYPVFLLLKHN